MIAGIERRRRASRCHPMRRAGDGLAGRGDRAISISSVRPAHALHHDAGFVAHLVAADLEAKDEFLLHHIAQQSAVLAYLSDAKSAMVRATRLRRTA